MEHKQVKPTKESECFASSSDKRNLYSQQVHLLDTSHKSLSLPPGFSLSAVTSQLERRISPAHSGSCLALESNSIYENRNVHVRNASKEIQNRPKMCKGICLVLNIVNFHKMKAGEEKLGAASREEKLPERDGASVDNGDTIIIIV